jgi:hypothetical protein
MIVQLTEKTPQTKGQDDWGKEHNEELHSLCSLSNRDVIIVIGFSLLRINWGTYRVWGKWEIHGVDIF